MFLITAYNSFANKALHRLQSIVGNIVLIGNRIFIFCRNLVFAVFNQIIQNNCRILSYYRLSNTKFRF